MLYYTQKVLLRKHFCFMVSYTQKDLLRKPSGVRLRALCARCVIDGFAKMPLQASIFASWYNIRRKPCFASLQAFASVRFAHAA